METKGNSGEENLSRGVQCRKPEFFAGYVRSLGKETVLQASALNRLCSI
jgi:hypothetical protein